MDFVDGHPTVNSKSVILLLVDHFAKYAHFIALGHLYTARSVARAYFDEIVRLYAWDAIVDCERSRPYFHKQFLVRAFSFGRCQIAFVFGLSSVVRWSDEGCEPYHRHKSS